MKFLTALIVALTITACGADDSEPAAALTVDTELQPILDRYIAAAPNRGHLDSVTSIQFGEPTHTEALGQCHKRKSERKVIIRRPKAMTGETIAVTLHELAHCIHDVTHSDDYGSLMYDSFVFYPSDYWTDERINSELIRVFEKLTKREV